MSAAGDFFDHPAAWRDFVAFANLFGEVLGDDAEFRPGSAHDLSRGFGIEKDIESVGDGVEPGSHHYHCLLYTSSLRSKQEIRAYLIQADKEDKDDAQRYADDKSLEAFGLIPKNFPLDSFMLDVLTEQVAGLYDPKAKEFYIADWIPSDEQRDVMSHELTHALEDQSFDVDPWIKAARPNDDAELARDSVSEGTALAAMLDYSLRDQHLSVREIGDVTALIRPGAIEEMDKDSNLAKAPIVIRDSLLFPYLAGTSFSQQFLKAHTGWEDLHLLFERPPVSTQQIIHPDFYLKNVGPAKVNLPKLKGIVPADWKPLEENVMGEFGVEEILKQFLDPARAAQLAPSWDGDRYALFEDAKTKDTRLVFLLALETTDDAARFFGQYSEALEMKYSSRTQLYRRPNFFQFQTDTGGVFLRCVDLQCITAVSYTHLDVYKRQRQILRINRGRPFFVYHRKKRREAINFEHRRVPGDCIAGQVPIPDTDLRNRRRKREAFGLRRERLVGFLEIIVTGKSKGFGDK